MPSLSIIFEDMPDGNVQIKSRSTRGLPEDTSHLSPAEIIMIEVSGFVGSTYRINDEGVIQLGTIITPDKPKLIL